MSVKFVPVQWNKTKWFYDAVLVVSIGVFLTSFLYLAPILAPHTVQVDAQIWRARAFGTCAFLLLTIILAIGSLARLDRRFLPLLYNRRHAGVATFFLATAHALFVLDWYFAFSRTPPLEALLGSNTSYTSLQGFPFETLGILALLVLAIMALTSHDFWLTFLGPRLWKSLHFLVYPAYVLATAHLVLGAWADQKSVGLGLLVFLGAGSVALLHAAASIKEWRIGRQHAELVSDGWRKVGHPDEIPDKCAKVVVLAADERAAIFKHKGKLSAVSNACAHQNGPLGEGKIVFGCITCPWHGFSYRLEDGISPPPFTEKIPTYRLRLDGDVLFIHERANPPGTYVAPIILEGAV